MYKIGDFSVLAKTTIKTLRYYEKEELLIPKKVDEVTGYRYYDSSQLLCLSKIVSLRQLGISIEIIRKILSLEIPLQDILRARKKEVEQEIFLRTEILSKIKFLLEEREMKYEVIVKEIPAYTIYYKEGRIQRFSDLTEFIVSSGEECKKLNPSITCLEPDYCYVSYLDKPFKDHDMKVRYAQAVNERGKENENIHFEKLKPVEAVCIYHKGAYEGLTDAYAYVMRWIEENGYEITECPRERYIDGMWNCSKIEDWLTEIEVPIRKRN